MVVWNQVMFVFSAGNILCSLISTSREVRHDCDGLGAMLNFAAHMSGYARYCPEMNA
jgi:hypothetical protein